MEYRKKPIIIEAIQWTGENILEVESFLEGKMYYFIISEKIVEIETLEGVMSARKGDYIIKGIKGEFYPCREDIFEQTYELVEDTQ